MVSVLSAAQVEQLRRSARRLARDASIPLHEAQDRIAVGQGFRNWSLLVKRVAPPDFSLAPIESQRPELRQRYYFHGDRKESDETQFYCAMCDLFQSAEHFDGREHDATKSVERYLRNVSSWAEQPAFLRRKWYRPDNAVNVLAAAVRDHEAARVAREASRSAFHRWVVTQAGRNDRIGDLAADIQRDEDFPVAEASLASLLAYLKRVPVRPEVLASMRAAFKEFSVIDRGK
ncbi:YozE family protein [Burkholderia multivorans]|uniref:YozE family protein n=1 Tax=Burkholderia multivorans TaxID=87883 RepID=UPI000A614F47|nr:YozE family protein [Burkholderia multivorans]